MPHCIIEYSDNIIEDIDFQTFFHKLHQELISDNLFKLEDIKSRALLYNHYYMGDGKYNKSFVAVTLKILSGRSTEIKKKLSEDLLDFLKIEFSDSINKSNCNITVRIEEIERESYSRFKSGKVE